MAPPDADALISHAGFVRDLAYRLLRDAHEAEDVVQQVFLTAMRRPPETNRPLRPWLRRVARNLAIDAHRSRGRREQSERIAAIEDSSDETADSMTIDVAKTELAATVLSLAEPYRTAVLLRFYHELSPAAIARRLDVPVETVRTRIKRGIVQLRGRLHGRDEAKRRMWAAVLVRLANDPVARPNWLSRWSPAIYLPIAAAIGAVSVWLWNGYAPAAAATPELASFPAQSFEPAAPSEVVPEAAVQQPVPPIEEAQLLRVRIVTDEGVLVPDARVDVYSNGDKVAEVRTDRNGEIEVPRSPGIELELRVGMTRISLAYSTEVPAESNASAEALTVIRVPSASSVSGRVVDADGFPVPYARVEGWFGVAEENWRGRAPDSRCMADRNGSFALLGLPRQFRVEAYWAHLVSRETYVARLERATELDDVELRLCESRTMYGQVVDENGLAVADAEVRDIAAEPADDGSDDETEFVPRKGDPTKTLRDGTFVMTRLAPEFEPPTQVIIDHPRHAPHIIPMPPPPVTDPTETVEYGLELGVGLDIWVTDALGRPLRNAEAKFFMISGLTAREMCDVTGRIRFTNLPSEAAGYLRVEGEDREPDIVQIKKLGRKGARVDVEIGKARVIRGFVLDANRNPIRGAKVTAILLRTSNDEDPAWRAAKEAAANIGHYVCGFDGRFVFSNTPWRAFLLDVRTPGGHRRQFEVNYDQVIVECMFDHTNSATAGSH